MEEKYINIHYDGVELEVKNNREARALKRLQDEGANFPYEVTLLIRGTSQRVNVWLEQLVFSEQEKDEK